MAEKEQVSKQISVYKNNKALLETLNCLRPAPKTTPWHIHAAGKKEGYSLIRLVAVDYSKGKDSISVYANLKPEEIKYIFMKLCFGFENFYLHQQKIFRKGEGDSGAVTMLTIERLELDEKGQKRNFPWSVDIHNGTGIVEGTRNGGQHCKSKSYRETGRVKIYLEDITFFQMLSRTCAVIHAFEQKELYREREIHNFQNLYRLIRKEMDAFVKQDADQGYGGGRAA